MPTAKPLIIPDRIANNPDLTQEQKEAIARRLQRSAASRRSARKLEALAQKQKRKDDDHRKIVAGGVAEAEAAENPEFAARWSIALEKRVRETERFLFPKMWPDAQRPARPEGEATVQSEESESEQSEVGKPTQAEGAKV